jgi:hypothetical protein
MLPRLLLDLLAMPVVEAVPLVCCCFCCCYHCALCWLPLLLLLLLPLALLQPLLLLLLLPSLESIDRTAERLCRAFAVDLLLQIALC